MIRNPENRNKPGGDLSEMNLFIEAISDLDLVDMPFSGRNFSWSNMQDVEIEQVIKNLPNSHAPGPDGFNGLFIKKCWNIIKEDTIRLFRDFWEHNIDLSSINSSFVTLIPKKENPESVDDYSPISLLNYSLKCITKILSTRLHVTPKNLLLLK